MSIGGLVVARVAMKPLATLNRPVLETVDVVTKESTVSFKERTDVTAVPAMGVVAETMTALVLAGEALRKFGGDSLAEVRAQPGRLRGLARARPRRPLGPRRRRAADRLTRLLLVGMMGAGKTTVGPPAGRPAGLALPRLRRRGGGGHRPAPCPRSSPSDGEAAFRAGRGRRPSDAALSGPAPVVVSVAGGAVLDPANRELLRRLGHGGLAAGRPGHPGRPGGRRRRPAPAGRRPGRPRWPVWTPSAARSTPRWPTWWSTSTA